MTIQTQKHIHNEIWLDVGRAWTSVIGIHYPANWWDSATPSIFDEADIAVTDLSSEELVAINGIHPDTIDYFPQYVQDEMASQATALDIPLEQHLLNVYDYGTYYHDEGLRATTSSTPMAIPS